MGSRHIGPLENFGRKLCPGKFGPLNMLVQQIRPQKIFRRLIGPQQIEPRQIEFWCGKFGKYLFRAQIAGGLFAAPISILGLICGGLIAGHQFPAPIFIQRPICCTNIYLGPNLPHQYLFGAQFAAPLPNLPKNGKSGPKKCGAQFATKSARGPICWGPICLELSQVQW